MEDLGIPTVKLTTKFEGHPAGHNVPGVLFVLMGLYWLFISYWTYFTQPRKHKTKYVGLVSLFSDRSDDPLSSKSWIPLPCCPRVPLESILKVVLPGIGIFVETFLNFYPDYKDGGKVKFMFVPFQVHFFEKYGEFGRLDRLQHICMYLSFVVSGVVDLISACTKLPRATNKIFLSFAFSVEYLLFAFHIHGRNDLNIAIHQLLMCFIAASIAFSALRLFTARNLLINAGLAGSIILQGTHLIQAGWLLYGGTKWNTSGHNNITFMASMTVFHLLGVGLFMVLTFVIMKSILRCKGKLQDVDYQRVSTCDTSEKIELMELANDADNLEV